MVDVVESVRWSFNHVLRAASVSRRGSQSVCFLSRVPAEAPQDRTPCWRLRVTAGLPVLRTHYTSSRKMLFGMRRDLQSSLEARNSSESARKLPPLCSYRGRTCRESGVMKRSTLSALNCEGVREFTHGGNRGRLWCSKGNGQQPRESALRQIYPLRCPPTLKPRAVVPPGQRP